MSVHREITITINIQCIRHRNAKRVCMKNRIGGVFFVALIFVFDCVVLLLCFFGVIRQGRELPRIQTQFFLDVVHLISAVVTNLQLIFYSNVCVCVCVYVCGSVCVKREEGKIEKRQRKIPCIYHTLLLFLHFIPGAKKTYVENGFFFCRGILPLRRPCILKNLCFWYSEMEYCLQKLNSHNIRNMCFFLNLIK